MFFKKFDRISPLITLSFKGENMHSSILSGILTILGYALTTLFGISYAIDFVEKKKPSAYFYNRFIKDAGKFNLNPQSLFHYFYFLNKTNSKIVPLDLNKVRIIGIENITTDNYASIDLESTNHWVYGHCKREIDSRNIGHLIENEEEFENSACIRRYYDSKTKKYYPTRDEKNFVWPSIAHGMSHPTFSYYGVIIEKCKDNNLRELLDLNLNKCDSNEAIDNYVYSKVIVLQLIDYYSDVLNYKEPFTKYFYSISNLLFPKYYTVNHMNFNPAKIKTHTGIILDEVVEEDSIVFSQNEKVTMDEEVEIIDQEGRPIYNDNNEKIYKSTGIVSSYYFYLQNRLQIYGRNYKKLQDILSSIGGLSRTFFLLANIINSFFSGYFTLSDTEELLSSIDNTDFYYEKIKNQKYQIKDKLSEKKKTFKKNKNDDDKRNSLQISLNKQNSKNDETNNKIMFNIVDNINKEKEKAESEVKNINALDEKNINEIIYEQKNNEIKNRKEKKSFNWFQFIWYKIRRKNPVISFYKDYRTKVISEESFIRGQLDIYKLEKFLKLI